MDEDIVKLREALTAISAENQALRQTELKQKEEIAALRKSLEEVGIDLAAQTRLLADSAARSYRASADSLAAARAAGIPALVSKAEIADNLANQANEIAARLMAYMVYFGNAIAGDASATAGKIPRAGQPQG